jgi:hypothetical protein
MRSTKHQRSEIEALTPDCCSAAAAEKRELAHRLQFSRQRDMTFSIVCTIAGPYLGRHLRAASKRPFFASQSGMTIVSKLRQCAP